MSAKHIMSRNNNYNKINIIQSQWNKGNLFVLDQKKKKKTQLKTKCTVLVLSRLEGKKFS